MSQESEQAQEARKAWEEHQGWFVTAVGTYYKGIPFGRNVLNDYKYALKAPIEKEIAEYQHVIDNYGDYHEWEAQDARTKLMQAKRFLSLLDTVKPFKLWAEE